MTRLPVSAIVLTHNRRESLSTVLDRLADRDLLEVIVVDSGSTDGTAEMVRSRSDNVRLIDAGADVGTAGRNLGAREAHGSHLLFVDDDSYPLAAAVERFVEAFDRDSTLGAVGGLIHDRDRFGKPIPADAVGTFDWLLRAGRAGPTPVDGLPASYFPGCGCMVRKEAFLGVGGYFEPYFLNYEENDLATRLIAAGWDVRYLPSSEFVHAKQPREDSYSGQMLRLRVRNGIWYYWLRFPAASALLRIPYRLAIELGYAAGQRQLSAWTGGIADAWRDRAAIRGARAPVERGLVRRVEMRRNWMEVRLLAQTLLRRVLGRGGRASTSA